MKGGITLAIYIAIGITGAAFGQSKTITTVAVPITGSDHAKTIVPMTKPPTTAAPPSIDRGWAPGVMPDADETVVIKYGHGGSLFEHTLRFAAYRNRKSKVEIRGPCYSACTIVAAYVPKADLCIAQGAFLAFHAVRSREKQEIMPVETAFMYRLFPEDIRSWIDRTGGYQHLPLDGFWVMHDSELWAMGYPRCK